MKKLFAVISLLVLGLGGAAQTHEELVSLITHFDQPGEYTLGVTFSGTPGEKFLIQWWNKQDTISVENADEIKISQDIIQTTSESTPYYVSIYAINPTGHILSLGIDSAYKYTDLYLKRCPELTTVQVSHNNLSVLVLAGCRDLKFLDCSYNRLNSIDYLIKAEYLTYLDFSHNPMDYLNLTTNLSNFLALQHLICNNTLMEGLYLSDMPFLETVQCADNPLLKELSLVNQPALKTVKCTDNPLLERLELINCPSLDSLDFSDNIQLNFLYISNNARLRSLDLSVAPNLAYLGLEGNDSIVTLLIDHPKLESLYLHDLPSLRYLSCRNTMLSDLPFSAYDSLPSLQTVECSDNPLLQKLMIYDSLPSLKTLKCSGNRSLKRLYGPYSYGLEELICTYNDSLERPELLLGGGNLQTVECSNNNQLKNLSLVNQPALKTVKCTDNPLLERLELINCPSLDSLDFSDNIQLNFLYISNNARLRSLDLSVAPNLAYLGLEGNDSIVTLLIDHPKLESLYLHDLPSLRYLSCRNTMLSDLSFSAHDSLPSLQTVDCSGNRSLKRLYLYFSYGLEELICTYNDSLEDIYLQYCPLLDSLNVSDNIQLKKLIVNNTKLRSLDLSKTPALESLFCTHNRLSSLRFPADVMLMDFMCDSNSLSLSNLANSVKVGPSTNAILGPQFIPVLRQVGQVLDLRSEMNINGEVTQWNILDADGNIITDNANWGANRNGNFSFRKTGRYRIAMTNYTVIINDEGITFAADVYYDVTIVDSVARPVFSEPSGAVRRHTPVSLSTSTPNARIYYTVDGSVPDSTALLYTAPIYIDDSITIKAIAIQDTLTSRVTTASYTIDVTDNEAYVTAEQIRVYAQDRSIILSENVGEVEVFTAGGQCVYRGTATTIPVKRSGLYVVVAQGGRWKVAVR